MFYLVLSTELDQTRKYVCSPRPGHETIRNLNKGRPENNGL